MATGRPNDASQIVHSCCSRIVLATANLRSQGFFPNKSVSEGGSRVRELKFFTRCAASPASKQPNWVEQASCSCRHLVLFPLGRCDALEVLVASLWLASRKQQPQPRGSSACCFPPGQSTPLAQQPAWRRPMCVTSLSTHYRVRMVILGL